MVMVESPIERLIKTNPDMEIWWDSSPLVFESWVQKMVAAAPADKKRLWEEQLRRLYNAEDPAKSVFRGCTTNPPLSLKAVQNDPKFWEEWTDNLISTNPGLNQKELFWLTYKEIVRRGAEMFMPIYKASNGRFGWISGQLDPRLFTETEQMVKDAQDLASIGPNVMIKVPGSTQGIEVLKRLASLGISTNTTTCFHLPQILASAEATAQGVELAKKNGVSLNNWRAVITMMIGRLTERPVLVQQAARRGIDMTFADRHWFGIAVFRRAYKMIRDMGYPSKMLACSLREGPVVAGKMRIWDIEEIAGGDIVYTLPPGILEPIWLYGEDIEFRPKIEEEVPQHVLEKMSKIPFCIQAYDPNGSDIEEFNHHPSTLFTVDEFSKASAGLEDFVAKRIAVVRK